MYFFVDGITQQADFTITIDHEIADEDDSWQRMDL
jgi:hypothetical protein